MSTQEKEIVVSDVVSWLNAFLDAELGAKDEQTRLPQFIGQLMASRGTCDRFTTKSNLFNWIEVRIGRDSLSDKCHKLA